MLYETHFTDEKIKAQRGQGTSPVSQSQQEAELGSECKNHVFSTVYSPSPPPWRKPRLPLYISQCSTWEADCCPGEHEVLTVLAPTSCSTQGCASASCLGIPPRGCSGGVHGRPAPQNPPVLFGLHLSCAHMRQKQRTFLFFHF